MRIFLGFDDTDTIDADRGTGKLSRWFGYELPEEVRLWAVVRQQLLVHEDIPYTSHNSSACVVMDAPDGCPSDRIIDRAVRHLQAHYLEGSDPGICMACEGDPGLSELMNFGISCILPVVSQKDALGKSSAADRTKGNRRNEKFYRFAAFRRAGGEPLLVLPCCHVCHDMAVCMPDIRKSRASRTFLL